MLKLSGTLFDSVYDNKTDKTFSDVYWKDFERILLSLSKRVHEKKTQNSLVSPAQYKEGTNKRCNDNVVCWAGWAALDVDEYGDMSFEEVIKTYSKYRYICYSTFSSTQEKPKFRLIFPLTANVFVKDIRHFWYALNKELKGIGDTQTKDFARMFYLPCTVKGAYNFFRVNSGGVLMNPFALMDKHEYIEDPSDDNSIVLKLPESLQRDYIKDQLKNVNVIKKYQWTDYRDCPFVNPRMVKEYMDISGSGWYSKSYDIMISVAFKALSKGYPITAKELVDLCKSIDNDVVTTDLSDRYKKRNFNKEANRALEYALKNL